MGQGRSRLRCLWFNATYLQDKFKPGQMIALYGKVEEDQRSRELQIVQLLILKFWETLRISGEDGAGNAAEKKRCRVAGDWADRSDLTKRLGRLTPRWFRKAIRTAPDQPNARAGGSDSSRGARPLGGSSRCCAALLNVHRPEPGESFDVLAVVTHTGA